MALILKDKETDKINKYVVPIGFNMNRPNDHLSDSILDITTAHYPCDETRKKEKEALETFHNSEGVQFMVKGQILKHTHRINLTKEDSEIFNKLMYKYLGNVKNYDEFISDES